MTTSLLERRGHALIALPSRARSHLAQRPVLAGGIALVVAQLAFRAWAVYGSWFQFDDFAWMAQSLDSDLTPAFLFQEYAGHLMPGGYLLSWIFAHVDPLNFWWPSTTLLVLQAVASFGLLRLLRHMFGDRPGILPPLCVYLFSVISLPAYVWWAAGINALPLQIALFYGLHAHVTYLRSGRFRYAVATMAWTVFGLFFFEKTLFVFAAYALVALSYFSSGWGLQRLRSVVVDYWAGVTLYAAVVVGYLVAYALLALNFDPNEANDHPLAPIVGKLVGKAFGSGIVGGPLKYFSRPPFSTVADPADLVVVLSWLVIGALVFELARTRHRSKRAWLLVLAVLLADVLLVTAARAAVVGPLIALEYRYQTEITGFVAIALALAALPLLGAKELVEPKVRSEFLDSRDYVVFATVIFMLVAGYSSYTYATKWQSYDAQKVYFTNLEADVGELRAEGRTVDIPDVFVPDFVLWALSYPWNRQQLMLSMFDDTLKYPDRSDDLQAIDDTGHLRPAVITPVRTAAPGPKPNCGYFVGPQDKTVPLNGPVIGAGWWIRLGYIASQNGTLDVIVGDKTYSQPLRAGLGQTFFEVEGNFDSLTLHVRTQGMHVCTNEVTLGLPIALPAP